MSRTVETLEARRLMHSALSVAVNFQPLNAPRAPGLLTDYGAVYGVRRGGIAYGWSADNQGNAVDRNLTKIQKNDTFIAMQSTPEFNAGNVTRYDWSIGVENGNYDVYVVAGDPGAVNDRMAVTVEGELAVSGVTRRNRRYLEGLTRVTVTDGKLTIGSAPWAVDNKICYVGIVSTEEPSGSTMTLSTPVPTTTEGSRAFGKFTLTRDGDLSEPVTVPVTIGGSATNGVDYGRFGTKVTFAAGVQSIDLPVRTVADDESDEGDETVTLTLSSVAGYQIVEGTATVTIRDTAAAPDPTPAASLAWTGKTARPVAASEIFGASVGSTLYTFGGYVDNTYKPTTAAYAYNVNTNTWTAKAALPVGLTHPGVVADGTDIYFAGGYPGTGTNGNQQFATTAVYKYDTVANTYTALPGLPEGRAGGAMTKLGNYLYFMGGTRGVTDSSRTDVSTVYRLDLTNTSAGWTTRASLPAARNHPAAVALNGFVYFLGGQTSQDANLTTQSNVYRYNPATDAWTSVAGLPGGRSHITDATFVYGGRIVVVAGQSAYESALASVLQYNPGTNQWTTLASLPAARFSGVSDLVDGKFVYTAGYNGGFKNNTYVGTLT